MERANDHARRVVARNLVRLRRARGLTQEQLAVAAGVRQAQISAIEAGKLSVRIDSLERIANWRARCALPALRALTSSTQGALGWPLSSKSNDAPPPF